MFFILNLLLFNSIQKDALRPTNLYVLLWKNGKWFSSLQSDIKRIPKKRINRPLFSRVDIKFEKHSITV